MSVKPLHPAIIAAAKIREEARRLQLLDDELEASAGEPEVRPPAVFKFGKVKQKKRRAQG